MSTSGDGASLQTRPTVLITWPDFEESWPEGIDAFARAGLDVRQAPRLHNRTPEELESLLDGVVGAVVSTDPFTASVLEASPQLRVIARVGVGFDSIDIETATHLGVVVTVTPGANEVTVADHTLALLLAAVRNIAIQDRLVRDRRWLRTGEHTPSLLTESTVGLVGFGRIGRLVARRLAGFDVEVVATDPAFSGDELVRSVSLDELLAVSDAVSLHVPLLPSTRLMIGAREFGLMKPGSFLVNTGRGGIVDEGALLEALRSGRLRAAGLDVFDSEPPTESPLLALDNVVLSAHIAGISDRSVREMVTRAAQSVIEVLQGKQPSDAINPSAQSRRRAGIEVGG